MPALLTCVVGKRLCASPEADNHWALRSHAAELVAEICRRCVATMMDVHDPACQCLTLTASYGGHRYGALYETLQPRVTKTLYAAFIDKRKPLTTQYGAIIGMCRRNGWRDRPRDVLMCVLCCCCCCCDCHYHYCFHSHLGAGTESV